MNNIYHKKIPDRKKKNLFFCFVFVFSVVLTFEVKECSRNLTFPSNTLSKKNIGNRDQERHAHWQHNIAYGKEEVMRTEPLGTLVKSGGRIGLNKTVAS